MRTYDLLFQQLESLGLHMPRYQTEKFSIVLGEARRQDLIADGRASKIFVQTTATNCLLEPGAPSWADGGNGHAFGTVGKFMQMYVFLHRDPFACHLEVMEDL